MSSNALSRINRLTKEIANLKLADSKEASKEAPIQSRINRANQTIQRTTNSSTIQSKQREVERGSQATGTRPGKASEFLQEDSRQFKAAITIRVPDNPCGRTARESKQLTSKATVQRTGETRKASYKSDSKTQESVDRDPTYQAACRASISSFAMQVRTKNLLLGN